jgi:holo-[acyl-carrier protein] synthase
MAFKTAELLAPSVQTGDATSNHLFDVARALRDGGARPQIICNYPPGPTPNDLRPLVRQTDYTGFQPGGDLLLLEYPSWFPLAERIRDSRGATIFSYHGVTPPHLWGSDFGREQMQISQIRTQLAWFAHLALTVSPYMRQELHQNASYPLERIRVLPLRIPLDQLRTRPPENTLARLRNQWGLAGKRVLLYIGRIAGNKRIDLAIEAVAQLRKEHPALHLLVIGSRDGNPAERELAARLEQQADRLRVGDAVTLTGRLEAVEPFLHLADVLVLPSVHEGFGAPLVEAMAVGTPVVASASAALPWVLDAEQNPDQAAGLLFRPGEASDLAQQIHRILTDEGLRRHLVQRGLARAEAFSPAAFAHGFAAVLAEVAELAHHPTPAVEHPAGKLYFQSDVALRNYRVRSGAPVVGRLIEWLRHNSTTHVKEAYLDPIIEQQVNYNRLLADEILQLQIEIQRLRADLSEQAPSATPTPPTIHSGVDLIEIARIRAAIERHGAHFLSRVYTPAEQTACGGRIESLAARFAGKEAVAKTLGAGVWRHGIAWTDIEISRDGASGAPVLRLQRAAAVRAAALGLRQWSVSLSHDRERAVALAVALK